ncbi:hypothetical protein LMH87_005316 [Akanthomyces muscarius]|uniref:N-acetyltransferase domain-containing protein n=1 Tax=Akanthomyces muscarius TaxID=2231603 RepID=A0A9W8QN14_AKAMU|nr:hypothetical protein LMH87_005316 [Akanthomyces muscarius]KAJ4163596.1 hypothetical protein LMH87_005316 [Akanthomyces muscarius]
MEGVAAKASNIWKSERLVYRAVEPRDTEIQAWIQDHMINDPAMLCLSTDILPRPRNLEQSNKLVLDLLAECLLGALIYLPSDSANSATTAVFAGKPATLQSEPANESPTPQSKNSPGTLIGFLLLRPPSPLSPQARASSVGITLDGAYVDKGYGSEALQWLVDWGFRYANLHRIGLSVNSFNDRAVAVYKRLGFVEEGRAREAVYFDRQWYDIVHMSILEQEWEALRSKQTSGV